MMPIHALNADADSLQEFLERRWFCCMTAVKSLEAEGDVLRAVMEMAEAAWRRNRTQLAELQALRDSLGESLEEQGVLHPNAPARAPANFTNRGFCSAA